MITTITPLLREGYLFKRSDFNTVFISSYVSGDTCPAREYKNTFPSISPENYTDDDL